MPKAEEKRKEAIYLSRLAFAIDDYLRPQRGHSELNVRILSARDHLRSYFDPIPCVLKAYITPDVYPTEVAMLAAAGVDFARNYSPESAKKLVKRGLRLTGSDEKAISAELIQWLAAESFRRPNGLQPGVHHKLAIDWLCSPACDPDLHMVCMRLADEMAARGDPLYVQEMDRQCLLNENGQNAASAAQALRNVRQGPEDVPIYEDGKLPNRHLVNRAKRGAVREYLKELYRKAVKP